MTDILIIVIDELQIGKNTIFLIYNIQIFKN